MMIMSLKNSIDNGRVDASHNPQNPKYGRFQGNSSKKYASNRGGG
jgi:hypothetical protein